MALSGCGLFPDLTHLSGGSPGADGGPPDFDAPFDSATVGDVNGRPGSPCSTPHDFCDDFDSSDNPIAKWTDQTVDAKGSINTTANAQSSPRAVEMHMARRSADNPDAYAIISKRFDGWRPMRVEYDMFLKQPSWQPDDVNAGFFHVDFVGTSPTTRDITISVGSNYKSVGGSVQVPGHSPLPTDTWVHFRFDIDPLKGRVAALVGNDEVTGTWSAFAVPSSASTVVSIGVLGYNEPAPAFDVIYDNVTVDFTGP
ncbi:MAG: hypothetical protein U0174_24440 [Polyangiaceae bacterium]